MADERILIVDDEADILELLERVCQGAGYQVLTAVNGAGARHILEQGFVHACVVDLRLPDAEGIEIMRHAKQLYPDCEVIILTAHGDLETSIEALRLGAYDYLQKPLIDLQLVPVVVSRALERQALARHNAQLLKDLQAANSELELRRRQQLQYISYLGHALSGALSSRDVVQVLVQTALESTNCEGAGVLLLRSNGLEQPWALTAARKNLSLRARDALVQAMMAHLPPGTSIDPAALQVQELPISDAVAVDDEPWRLFVFGLLTAREEFDGLAVVASHSEQPFAEEALRLFEILVTQGSVALANARLFARTNELATRDGLTGVYNHRHFFELLEAEISRAERHGLELAVVMLDIDSGPAAGLKAINDTYGHQAGDAALRTVARCLQESVRRADVVARYGGDEFIILAPQTGKEKALGLANRLCRLLRETPYNVAGYEAHLTMSMGAAVFQPGRGDNANTVVNRADRGVYLAKERGGDQACMVALPEASP